MFLNKSDLKNTILKCDKCKKPFDEYCQPKFLPCFKTICTTCELTIQREAINRRFKCGLCLKDHYIPDDGFVIDETKYALIKAEPMEISRGENYDNLHLNLNKLETLFKILKNGFDNGIDKIKEHCTEQIRLIQLSTENRIEQINKLNDELIKIIRDYERKCIQSFLDRSDEIKQSVDKLIGDASIFVKEKQEHLLQFKIDDEEIKTFNKQSELLQESLNKESIKLNSLIFNNEILEFWSNTNEIKQSFLGDTVYETSNITRVISSSADNTVKLWGFESNECLKTFSLTSSVLSVIKAPNNKIICGFFDGTIKILDIESGKCLVTIKEHFEAIQNLKLISNEKFITCSNDKTIKLFDLNTFECIRTFIGHKRSVKGIDKISDHQIVSCSDDKTIRIWDLNSGECLKILRGHEDGVTCVTVISDKKIISSSNYKMKIWNVETETCLQTLKGANTGCIFSIIILSNERIISANEDGKIVIWDNGEILKIIDAHSSGIWGLVKLSKNKIISGSNDKTIKVWDIESGDCLNTIEAHTNYIFCLNAF